MNTLAELRSAVQSDLTLGSESSLFPQATIDLAINRSYNKAGGLYRWPETEDAKKTSTIANQEYYEYPDNWRPDTIWKLKVDDVDYGDPLVFKDYLFEKENNFPSGLSAFWSSQWRRLFIYPTPTTNGNNNISVWGQKVTDPLVNDTDTTIFSYSAPECNEAIVLEAVAILRTKGGEEPAVLRRYIGGSLLLSVEAKQILDSTFAKIRMDQMKYEKTTPMFDVPNFFPTGRNRNQLNRKIGDF